MSRPHQPHHHHLISTAAYGRQISGIFACVRVPSHLPVVFASPTLTTLTLQVDSRSCIFPPSPPCQNTFDTQPSSVQIDLSRLCHSSSHFASDCCYDSFLHFVLAFAFASAKRSAFFLLCFICRLGRSLRLFLRARRRPTGPWLTLPTILRLTPPPNETLPYFPAHSFRLRAQRHNPSTLLCCACLSTTKTPCTGRLVAFRDGRIISGNAPDSASRRISLSSAAAAQRSVHLLLSLPYATASSPQLQAGRQASRQPGGQPAPAVGRTQRATVAGCSFRAHPTDLAVALSRWQVASSHPLFLNHSNLGWTHFLTSAINRGAPLVH